jgi:hypothetical protein
LIFQAQITAKPLKPTNRKAFNQQQTKISTKPIKIWTPEQVRERTALKVSAIRATLQPKYKASPYPPTVPKTKKMSMKFNKAASVGNKASRPATPSP